MLSIMVQRVLRIKKDQVHVTNEFENNPNHDILKKKKKNLIMI